MQSDSIATTGKILFTLAILIGITAVATLQLQAQSFSVVHNFTGGSDGAGPMNGFTGDVAGNLYGTASIGGTSNFGVVFRLSPNGAVTVLHNFAGGVDGATPDGALIRDKAGNFYGTTTSGGVSNAGTVFRITPAGQETVLYTFTGGADGKDPEAGLAIDGAGNLYGTTQSGGAKGNGTVFRLAAPKTGGKWAQKVLYSFGGGTDGTLPVAGVTLTSGGRILGTTSTGGQLGFGTIFQLAASGSNWIETTVHHFKNTDDGGTPYAGLIADKAGNLYGAATQGGNGGGGTVFKLTPAGNSWTFAVLFSQPGWGVSGSFRNLVMDGLGNLYGTTHCDGASSAGTVYKLTPATGSWKYTELYMFTGGTDGLYSFSNLSFRQGKLYGTTNLGGSKNFGTIFSILP